MGPGGNGDLNAKEQDIEIHVVSSSESSEKDAENAEDAVFELDKGVYRAMVYWGSRREAWRQEWMSKFEVDRGAERQRRQAAKSAGRAKRKFYDSERARGATP